jgi:hypothetical protein
MRRCVAVCIVAAFLLGPFIAQVSARGRSFPIEATGTIAGFDRATRTFTMQVDEPARILTIAVGRNCKFIENGVSTGERILKKAARVRVSYFATLFTGNIAVKIESNPAPEVANGVIEKIKRSERKLTIWVGSQQRHMVLHWALNARVFTKGRRASAMDLRENTAVRLSYYSPAFGSKYATEIEAEPRF